MYDALADHPVITLPRRLLDEILATITERYPRKSFGYLLSDADPNAPTDVLFFESNIRNDAEWRPAFESYGRYFVDYDDAGFVASPEESWRIQQAISSRGLTEVGVFHSHQRHPANFSRIDYEMHLQRFICLWHMIISLRNPQMPQVRAYAVSIDGVHEIDVQIAV